MSVPALSGEDVPAVKEFLDPLLREPLPLAGPPLGWSSMLPGWLRTCCLHEVTYQGGHVVLEGLLYGLYLSPSPARCMLAASTGPLIRGVAK